jgi:3-deoxy-7-phosphoheptulonate synthase
MANESAQTTMEMWTPSSWETKPDPYRIVYRDGQATEAILDKLVKLPGLVTKAEVSDLKIALREVALGKAFIWQGGDCAELFDYCEDGLIQARIRLLLQLGMIFSQMTQVPTLLLGRMAGQYGKPRNGLTETIEGVEVPKFYGDNINSYDVRKREPDPERMLLAYFHSSSTLNHVRSTLTSEGANCYRALDWELGPITDKRIESTYKNVVADINDGLMSARSQPRNIPFIFTSHEGLFLRYEQALTKPWSPKNMPQSSTTPRNYKPARTRWFNSSAHFIWIGDKTRQLGGAHVEYFRGLENPIGIKVGPSIATEELVQLLHIVNPEKEVGKVTLITRLGEGRVGDILGNLIKAVQGSGHTVIWQCDPMHGNTRITSAGIRTRSFSSIVNELLTTMGIHKEHNSYLGGVHIEMTPDDVVECVGGNEGWTDGQLGTRYCTKCDPRLNKKQSLEIAFLVANHYHTCMDDTTSFSKARL